MNPIKKKPKAGVPLKEAQALGYAQIVGMPGVAYAKGGKLFGATLAEVNDKGERIEPLIEEAPAPAGEDGFVADALPVESEAIPPAGAVPTGDLPESDAVPEAEVNPLQAAVNTAQAELDAWTAENNSNTEEGKREYNRLYARVRSAKKALEKVGA